MKRITMMGMACLMIFGCAPQAPVAVDAVRAAESTNAFFRQIMQEDYSGAYAGHMSPGLKFNPATSPEQFAADWTAIHEKYGPIKRAVFETYQPVPNRRVIQLYYSVEHAKVAAPISYHFVLEQDKSGRITIFIIDIGNEKLFPPNVTTPAEKLTLEKTYEILPEAENPQQ